MTVKIHHRSAVIWNLVLFVLFSMVFLYLQDIFKTNSTVRDLDLWINFVKGHFSIAVIMGLTIFFIILQMRLFASLFYSLTIGITALLTVYNISLDFSKYILIILFFYLVIAFYFYQFFSVETSESYYNSLYDKKFLYPPMLMRLNVNLEDKNGNIASGVLTNWSENGCFVCLDEFVKLSGAIKIKINFNDRFFEDKGIIASTMSQSGYGLKFIQNSSPKDKKELTWNEFYEIIEEMGLRSELVV